MYPNIRKGRGNEHRAKYTQACTTASSTLMIWSMNQRLHKDPQQKTRGLGEQNVPCTSHKGRAFLYFRSDFQGQPAQLFSHTHRKVI